MDRILTSEDKYTIERLSIYNHISGEFYIIIRRQSICCKHRVKVILYHEASCRAIASSSEMTAELAINKLKHDILYSIVGEWGYTK